MSSTSDHRQQLQQHRDQLCEQFTQVGDLRPGSLVERYRRCGKLACHCAREGDPGHGPSWSLTRAIAGKTVTKVIPAAGVEQTRRQLDEHRRFREICRDYVEASEKICDAQLAALKEAPDEGAEKGGSATNSRRRLKPKSPR